MHGHANAYALIALQSLDELLCDIVCRSLSERLATQYPGQIVQILTNIKHLEMACHEVEDILVQARSASSVAGPIHLRATAAFGEAKTKAEGRIFKVVNSKIDDLVETAEYDWYVIMCRVMLILLTWLGRRRRSQTSHCLICRN